MNSIWHEFLAATGARIDQDLVTDFGDPPGELSAACTATIVSPLTHLRLIAVGGPEAAVFLHNQVTSDIKHLATDAAQHSAWCSAKGRMLASFLVFRSGADYQLQLSADLLTMIVRRLQMFVLRSKVTIADLSGNREILGLAGPHAVEALQALGLPVPDGPLNTAVGSAGLVIRLDSARFQIVTGTEDAAALWRRLAAHARPVGTAVWQWLDIQAGIPLITERTREEFVPQMANFERLGGVSFHKGCYPGQEIVARSQYLGKVKRRLHLAHLDAEARPGDELFAPDPADQSAGLIANAAPAPEGGWDVLAVVLNPSVEAGEVRLKSRDGAKLSFKPLPYPVA